MGSVFGVISEETPKFDLVASAGDFEVRRYHENLAVETDSNGDNASFMTLADYIGVRGQPQNERQQPISMTAPVVTTHPCSTDGSAGAGNSASPEKMQFILPSSLKNSAPAPSRPGVRLMTNPEKLMAVRQFSGTWGPARFEAERDTLVASLGVDGRFRPEPSDPVDWQVYRYNPPWTLPFLKTTEVAVRVKEAGPPVGVPKAE